MPGPEYRIVDLLADGVENGRRRIAVFGLTMRLDGPRTRLERFVQPSQEIGCTVLSASITTATSYRFRSKFYRRRT